MNRDDVTDVTPSPPRVVLRAGTCDCGRVMRLLNNGNRTCDACAVVRAGSAG